jgi:drug/metabolite transporter (DMT)-like permease
MAWVFLGQTIGGWQALGIALTVGSVVWVVTDRAAPAPDVTRERFRMGIFLGLVGALGQSANLITARMALGADLPTISASYVRIVVAAFVLWSLSAARGQTRHAVARWSDRRALAAVAAGSFVGPFLGIWLSLVAIQNTEVGVAATLMALPPVLLIPIGYFLLGERVTRRAVAGTTMAFAGVACVILG